MKLPLKPSEVTRYDLVNRYSKMRFKVARRVAKLLFLLFLELRCDELHITNRYEQF
jgi:hypothetical protein